MFGFINFHLPLHQGFSFLRFIPVDLTKSFIIHISMLSHSRLIVCVRTICLLFSFRFMHFIPQWFSFTMYSLIFTPRQHYAFISSFILSFMCNFVCALVFIFLIIIYILLPYVLTRAYLTIRLFNILFLFINTFKHYLLYYFLFTCGSLST